MVAGDVVDLHAGVGQPPQSGQYLQTAGGYCVAVFEPEVEQIAHDVEALAFLLDLFQQLEQARLLRGLLIGGFQSQVYI